MKSEQTSRFIIEKVAPIFNKKGYVGTSMSEITKAVGMTKGAIYGNFENKESLAISSFEHNIRIAIFPLFEAIKNQESSLSKLRVLTSYYGNYYEIVKEIGGCPLLRVGIDAGYHNPILFNMSRNISSKLIETLTSIIDDGVYNGEFKRDTDSELISREIFSIIEGSMFMSLTHEDESYMTEAMNLIDSRIIDSIIE